MSIVHSLVLSAHGGLVSVVSMLLPVGQYLLRLSRRLGVFLGQRINKEDVETVLYSLEVRAGSSHRVVTSSSENGPLYCSGFCFSFRNLFGLVPLKLL